MVHAPTDHDHGQPTSKVWAHASASPALRIQLADRHDPGVRLVDAGHRGRGEEPPARARATAGLVICALGGIQERVAAGVPVDVPAFRQSLLALVG